jgi:cytochrome P450
VPTVRLLEQFHFHLAQGQEDFEIESAYGKTRIVNHPGRAEQILQDESWQRTSLLTMALGQGLLANDGALWSSQRQKLSPHFGGQLLRDFEQHTLRLLGSHLVRWDSLASRGKIWHAGDDLSRLTLDVAAAALLSLEGPELDPVSGAVTEVVTGLGKISATMFAADLRLDPHYLQRLRDSIETLDRFAYQLIERRRQQPGQRRRRGRSRRQGLQSPPGRF